MIVNFNHLKAANIFAGKEEVRPYLNGVFIEVRGGVCNIVATDGHRLIKFECDQTSGDMSFIIPRGLIDGIKKAKLINECDVTISEGVISILYDGIIYKAAAVDATYPNWRRVVPDIENERKATECIGFNAAYLGDFAKVNKTLGLDKNIRMDFMRTDQKVLVTACENPGLYSAFLMPVRLF